MKKLLTIVFFLAVTVGGLYFTNTNKKDSNLSLSDLITKNIVEAETVTLDGCRKYENRACQNGTITVSGCDESSWYQADNCEYEF